MAKLPPRPKFKTLGTSYKLIRSASLNGQKGMKVIGFYLGVTTDAKGTKILVKSLTQFSLTQTKGKGKEAKTEVDHFACGDVLGIAGGGQLKNKLEKYSPPLNSLCVFTYMGTSPMKTGEFAGTDAHIWEVENDPNYVWDGEKESLPKNIEEYLSSSDEDDEDDEDEDDDI